MKIFDCFMYFDEDLVLDLRLNLLDNQSNTVGPFLISNLELEDCSLSNTHKLHYL